VSTETPLRPRERNRPRSSKPAAAELLRPEALRRILEAAALALLLTAGVLGFGPSFGADPRYLVAGLGGVVLGLGLAAAAAARRWGMWATAGAAGGTYLVLGSALAAPVEAAGGVLPTLGSLRVLVLGLVFAWKDLLTVAPPVGTAGGMLVVPFLLSLLAGLTAGLLSWRARGAYWPALPVLALFAAGIAFGTKDVPMPGLRALLLAAGLLTTALSWLPLILGGAALTGVSVSWVAIAFITLRQTETPTGMQGRTAAATQVIMNVPQVGASMIAAVLIGIVDYRAMIVAMSALCALAVLPLVLGSGRSAAAESGNTTAPSEEPAPNG